MIEDVPNNARLMKVIAKQATNHFPDSKVTEDPMDGQWQPRLNVQTRTGRTFGTVRVRRRQLPEDIPPSRKMLREGYGRCSHSMLMEKVTGQDACFKLISHA